MVMAMGKKDDDKKDDQLEQPETQAELFPLPPETKVLATDWHDPEHQWLVVTLVDADGSQVAQGTLPAPLNKGDGTFTLVLSVEHQDGCSRDIDHVKLVAY
jgi:hypothetical protein